MAELRFLENKAKGVKVQNIKEVQAEWVELSDLLHLPPMTVRNLRAYPNWIPESACRSVFVDWLSGKGSVPITWGTLIEVFKTMGYSELSHKITLALEV